MPFVVRQQTEQAQRLPCRISGSVTSSLTGWRVSGPLSLQLQAWCNHMPAWMHILKPSTAEQLASSS
jgi:hypothetical protein